MALAQDAALHVERLAEVPLALGEPAPAVHDVRERQDAGVLRIGRAPALLALDRERPALDPLALVDPDVENGGRQAGQRDREGDGAFRGRKRLEDADQVAEHPLALRILVAGDEREVASAGVLQELRRPMGRTQDPARVLEGFPRGGGLRPRLAVLAVEVGLDQPLADGKGLFAAGSGGPLRQLQGPREVGRRLRIQPQVQVRLADRAPPQGLQLRQVGEPLRELLRRLLQDLDHAHVAPAAIHPGPGEAQDALQYLIGPGGPPRVEERVLLGAPRADPLDARRDDAGDQQQERGQHAGHELLVAPGEPAELVAERGRAGEDRLEAQ
jgi:hypothetical protein